MGWNLANAIVDPQVALMVKAVDNGEMHEAVAEQLLRQLILKCQESDWDTEGETLEEWLYVPWVVRAFAACDVTAHGDERPDRTYLIRAINTTITSGIEQFPDLAERYQCDWHAERIADAVLALLPEEK